MKLTFNSLAIVIALLFSMLALAWLFVPQRLLAEWAIASSLSTIVVSRRMAPLYAGIAVMFWLARKAEPSLARLALVRGLTVACLLLAALGVFELVAGHAAPGILVAVAIEAMLTIALLYLGRTEKREK